VTITHPYHPQCGQQVQVIQMRRGGADPDLLVQLPEGRHVVVAMSWTDYAGPCAGQPMAVSPPPLLDWDGLHQAAQLLEHIRQEARDPPGNETRQTCLLDSKRYA
jgi:hypothetical protein